jgi:hypothetical protein
MGAAEIESRAVDLLPVRGTGGDLPRRERLPARIYRCVGADRRAGWYLCEGMSLRDCKRWSITRAGRPGRCPTLERLEMGWDFDMHTPLQSTSAYRTTSGIRCIKPLCTLKRLVRIKDPQYLPVSPKPCRRTPLSPFLPSVNSASPPGCSCKLRQFHSSPHRRYQRSEAS